MCGKRGADPCSAAQSFMAGRAIGQEFKQGRVQKAREAKQQEFQDMFGGKEVDRTETESLDDETCGRSALIENGIRYHCTR